MRRFIFLSGAIVLLATGLVRADLMVQEHIIGQKVTFDTNTNYYWYWNLADFVSMDYAEQKAKIAGLGAYGNIAGGWHMAKAKDIVWLWNNYTANQLADAFGMSSFDAFHNVSHLGRIDEAPDWCIGYHFGEQIVGGTKVDLLGIIYPDDQRAYYLGAWVCTEQQLVPLPPAVILAATGMLSATLGLKRLRRKHQE